MLKENCDCRAAIDVGTNSVKLMIGSPGGGRSCFDIRTTRLGEDLAATGAIGDSALERTVAVLNGYVAQMQLYGVSSCRAVATEALRRAENAADVCLTIKRLTGIRLDVISGAEEARLSRQAVLLDFENSEDLLVVNCGGGSTELVGGNFSCSLDLGALILSRQPNWQALSDKLEAVTAALDELGRVDRIVGIGGAAVSLAALKIGSTDFRCLNGVALTLAEVEQLTELLSSLDHAGRLQLPGIFAERAAIIPAGAAIYCSIMQRLGAGSLVVSTRSICDALIEKV